MTYKKIILVYYQDMTRTTLSEWDEVMPLIGSGPHKAPVDSAKR